MIDIPEVLRRLAGAGVEFMVVGGVAAIAHGSARLTQDLDIVYRRTPDNLGRLVGALAPLAPYLRGAPAGLPFRWDEDTLRRGLNFTLTTSAGDLDVLGEVTGGGGFDHLLPRTGEVEAFGCRFRCVDLETLIRLKRAAGRPKHLEAMAELETLRDEAPPR